MMLGLRILALSLASFVTQVVAISPPDAAIDVRSWKHHSSVPGSSHFANSSVTQIATDFPDPNVDSFYSIPANISAYHPGHVIRSRKVITTVTGRSASSYQLFYRTADNHNNATGNVATIWSPAVPNWPPQIFSYQQAEDALNRACAPSWAWVNSSSTMAAYYQETAFVIQWALNQGYYVVVGDDEGPNSAWLVGLIEGRAALDAIRATRNFLRLPVNQTEISLLGYSGGAHTSVWASSLAASYAPELRIVSAAYGGTPVDLGSAYTTLNGQPSALLAGGAIQGLANGYPLLNASIHSLLTQNGTSTFSNLVKPSNCINVNLEHFANFNFSTLFKNSNPLDDPIFKDVLMQESLLSNVSALPIPVPKFPRFEWHGTADSIVPYAPEAQYVQQQCARGADIRFVSLPGLDHAPNFVQGLLGALQFVQQGFSRTLGNVTCGANVTIPTIGSPEGLAVGGFDVNTLLAAAVTAGTA